MIEIKVNITGLEELSNALITLTSALAIGKDSKNPDLNRPVPVLEPTDGVPYAYPTKTLNRPVPVLEPTTPVTPVAAPLAQPVAVAPPPTQTAPVTPQPAVVPTTTRTYTMDELGAAGAQLMQTVGMPALTNLINSFGVASLMELPKERYNEFALKLREMGAQI